ncbi:MAG: V-type ATPase 116kDa subunit family protein, partial [Candidatus Micrarchaeota archaeon]
RDFEKVRGALESGVKGVVVQNARMREGEGPTLLDNPRIVGPFEFLVEFYSLPRPNEIDPSMVLMLTFPIIYGMMLGDVIYGVISFLIAMLIISKTKPGMLQGFARLWAYAAIPAAIFGIIFDEWMGFTHAHLLDLLFGEAGVEGMGLHLPLYHGISRVENVGLLLVLTIITGMIHLSLGLVLGALNEWNHNRVHAHAKLGWVFVEWGGFFVLSTLLFQAFAPVLMYAGALVFLLGAWLIVRADGLFGIIEIPGIAGNTMSYARIAAVGIAGVIPAEFVINKLLLPSGDLITMLILMPIFLGVHVFNVILGMFESLVQGARLNLVEFYTKFFHGSGRKFSPFRVERVYTEEEE